MHEHVRFPHEVSLNLDDQALQHSGFDLCRRDGNPFKKLRASAQSCCCTAKCYCTLNLDDVGCPTMATCKASRLLLHCAVFCAFEADDANRLLRLAATIRFKCNLSRFWRFSRLVQNPFSKTLQHWICKVWAWRSRFGGASVRLRCARLPCFKRCGC